MAKLPKHQQRRYGDTSPCRHHILDTSSLRRSIGPDRRGTQDDLPPRAGRFTEECGGLLQVRSLGTEGAGGHRRRWAVFILGFTNPSEFVGRGRCQCPSRPGLADSDSDKDFSLSTEFLFLATEPGLAHWQLTEAQFDSEPEFQLQVQVTRTRPGHRHGHGDRGRETVALRLTVPVKSRLEVTT